MKQWKIDTHHIDDFLDSLSAKDYTNAYAALAYLEERGPSLGRPFVDTITSSRHKNMKELRPQSSSIRILFAFDRKRHAITLVAGDKRGKWNKWYATNVPLADKRLDEHYANQEQKDDHP